MRDRLLPTMLLSLAAFAVVSTSALYFGTLRKALPFPNQDRLELIYGSSQQLASNRAPTSYEDWRDLRRDAQRWEDIALSRTTSFGFEQDARTVLLAAARVTSNLPAVLGIRLHAGSGFVGKPGEEAEDQAIISHRIWRSAFAGRDVIGTRHRIGGADRTIVGVLPPDARYPEPETDVWIPLRPAGPELQRNFRFARAVRALPSMKDQVIDDARRELLVGRGPRHLLVEIDEVRLVDARRRRVDDHEHLGREVLALAVEDHARDGDRARVVGVLDALEDEGELRAFAQERQVRCHRISASAPTMRALRTSILGW